MTLRRIEKASHTIAESDDLAQSAKFQERVLSEINAYWIGQPFIVLHGLFELVGAIASAMVKYDGARVELLLAMVDALRARIASTPQSRCQ